MRIELRARIIGSGSDSYFWTAKQQTVITPTMVKINLAARNRQKLTLTKT